MSFAKLNNRIGVLHKTVLMPRKQSGKACAAENDMEANYNGNGGGHDNGLTENEEQEDAEHWQQILAALPQNQTITDYYVEIGYQMPAPTPISQAEERSNSFPDHVPSTQSKSRAKKWVPRLANAKKRAAPPPLTPTFGLIDGASAASSSSLAPAPRSII